VAAKRRIGLVALVFFLGVIVGSVVGEVIGLILPEGNVMRELFVSGKVLKVGPLNLDLIVLHAHLRFLAEGEPHQRSRNRRRRAPVADVRVKRRNTHMVSSLCLASLGPGPCLIGPIGTGELLIILFLVVLFFGPKRLPEVAEAVGKSVRKFREASRDVKTEIESSTEKKPTITEGKDKQG